MDRIQIFIGARTLDGRCKVDVQPIPEPGQIINGREVVKVGRAWEQKIHRDHGSEYGLPPSAVNWFGMFCYAYLVPKRQVAA